MTYMFSGTLWLWEDLRGSQKTAEMDSTVNLGER